MTDKPARGGTATQKRIRGVAMLLIALAAAGVWASGRMTWVTAQVFDDKAGDSTHKLVGDRKSVV